jgi:hypothetical protein
VQTLLPELDRWNQRSDFAGAGPQVGQILEITPEGNPLVDFPGNPSGLVEARSVIQVARGQDLAQLKNLSVLLVFENGDPALPIIVGIVRDALCPASAQATLPVSRPREATIDGTRIVLDAKEEIVLRCGKSSITLARDGKIVVKGVEIVSRASGTNKIRGAAVKIN